jgi:aquaporin Z
MEYVHHDFQSLWQRRVHNGVVFLTETVITALFLVVIVGATCAVRPPGAPIATSLALTMFHLVAIPISNASLNPARSTATAIFGGAQALDALWLFWVAPISGRRDWRRHLSLVTE